MRVKKEILLLQDKMYGLVSEIESLKDEIYLLNHTPKFKKGDIVEFYKVGCCEKIINEGEVIVYFVDGGQFRYTILTDNGILNSVYEFAIKLKDNK